MTSSTSQQLSINDAWDALQQVTEALQNQGYNVRVLSNAGIDGKESLYKTGSFHALPTYRPHSWLRRLSPHTEDGSRSEVRGKRDGPVLVVEDELNILETVADFLELEGYEVERAINGEEALRIMQRVNPWLIILDMRMPALDGWQFSTILKDRGVAVPILVMTAAQDARRWAQEIGAAGYIAKPFDLQELATAVERIEDRN